MTAGVLGFDEIYVWTGRLERFDWKLVGKKEMYVPYNSNMSVAGKEDNDHIFMGDKHVNPDHVRYELHRVWVVEATVKPGLRHLSPKAKYYVDEDNWIALLGDHWDAKGQFWKSGFNTPVVLPEVPTTFTMNFGFIDFTSGTQYYAAMYGNTGRNKITWKENWPTGFFTPDSLAGEGIR